MKVTATKTFRPGKATLYKGGSYELEDKKAQDLIKKGLVVPFGTEVPKEDCGCGKKELKKKRQTKELKANIETK